MKQSSFCCCLALLLCLATTYDIVGSWQLSSLPAKYEFLTDSLTFQFAKSADANGITTKLFVYDCFLSQFLYEVEDNEISLNFQTSSLLTQSCLLSPINQLRTLVQKVFFFQIIFDRLLLLSLNGEAVFELIRHKHEYEKVLSGAWLMNNPQGIASSPAKINGTHIYLCSGQTQLAYTISTTNGSYPRLTTVLLTSSPSCDAVFAAALQATLFLQLAQNLTQLTFFDANSKYLMTFDQIGTINASQSLIVSGTASPPLNKPTASSLQSQQPLSQQLQPAPQYFQPQPQPQQQQQQQAQIQYQSKQAQSQTLQQTLQSQPLQKSQTQDQTSIINNNYNIPTQTATKTQTTNNPQQDVSSSTDSSSFSWNFNQNNAFGGSFSSSSLFSFDPAVYSYASTPQITTTPSTTPDQTNQQQYSSAQQSTQQDQNTQNQQYQDTQQYQIQQDQSTQQQYQSTQQQYQSTQQQYQSTQQQYQSSAADSTTPMEQNQPSDSNLSAGSSNMQSVANPSSVAELISKSMSGGVAMQQVVVSSKWLLVWLNGISNLGQFSRVYMIFTSTRIILYCPCNTYYSNYRLQGTSLLGLSWVGTHNQCESNNDRRVTDYIFYANAIRQKGQNIGFYFNSQAQLAEFKPYY